MKKILLLFVFMFSMLFSTSFANEIDSKDQTDLGPCSTTYEIYVNGSYVGWHTEYSWSLGCSGHDTYIVDVRIRQIYA